MNQLGDALLTALQLLTSLDRELAEIVVLSLRISLSAVALAVLIGMPLGAALALARFPGRGALVVLLNACMGLPPVVVGLFVYLCFRAPGRSASLACCSRPPPW